MEGSSSPENKKEQVSLQTQNRYVLIVVGRMGHGKSSFTKMIVSDEQKNNVKAHTGIKSGTWDCKLYRSNRFNDIFGQDIYVLDTPGIDSKEQQSSKTSISLIVQDIDDLIIKHQAQIIGIVYALDIQQREEKQGGEGFIFSFLDMLRIKYCHKKSFAFCILTKFDKHYQSQEENLYIIKQFQSQFQKQQYGQMWNNRIQWMSQPDKSVSVYEKKIKGILKQRYDNQWVQLVQNFKRIKQEKQILTYQLYQKDRIQFEQIFKKNIIKQCSSFQYKNTTQQFQISINVLEEMGIFETIVRHIGVAVLQAVFLPIAFGLIGFSLYKYIKRFKGVVLSSISQKEKQKILSQRLSQKLSIFLITAVSSSIVMDSNCFTFENLPYITKVQCLDEEGKQIKIKKIENDTKLRAWLRLGQNRIRFTYKLPNNDCYKKFFKEHSTSFYNNKKE